MADTLPSLRAGVAGLVYRALVVEDSSSAQTLSAPGFGQHARRREGYTLHAPAHHNALWQDAKTCYEGERGDIGSGSAVVWSQSLRAMRNIGRVRRLIDSSIVFLSGPATECAGPSFESFGLHVRSALEGLDRFLIK